MKELKRNTQKLTKVSGQKRKVKNSKLSKKNQLKNRVDEALKTEDHKQILKFLSAVAEIDANKQKKERKFVAMMYCYTRSLFDDDTFKQGVKEYLLRLLPVKKNDKGKDDNQNNRNKYSRALRFLREEKVTPNEEKALAKIKEFGLQTIFNGKRPNKIVAVSKAQNKISLKGIIKKASFSSLIKEVVTAKMDEEIGDYFAVFYVQDELYFSQKSRFVKNLVAENKKTLELVKEEKSNGK